ncbi:multiple sugar transport system permease protein/putative aldouronate transport system permease protein [Paenibacillus sp. VMFN-D1]|nr:multiple sugar transport system permease protein/putative aldouronate transport system permease protein [Paenibacillus sp. VMFN-D1]
MHRMMSRSYQLFNAFNILFMCLLGLAMFLPFLNVIAQSFSSSEAVTSGKVTFWPVDATTINYRYVFSDASIWRAFAVSVFITVAGTLINLVATATLAYPVSREEYVGRKLIMLMVLITMIFSAPLIPNFLLMKNLQLMNTPWAMILPGAISAFNFFVMHSFFRQLPAEVIDSARIDGCGEVRILMSMVVPLSKPVMASLGIFYAVGHWNAYMNALYYIDQPKWWPLQVLLKKMFETDDLSIDPGASQFSELAFTSPEGIKMATIVIATLPIILLYPFLQKHFVKGLTLGAVKS